MSNNHLSFKDADHFIKTSMLGASQELLPVILEDPCCSAALTERANSRKKRDKEMLSSFFSDQETRESWELAKYSFTNLFFL